jgi:hypothetical protein
MSRIHGNTQEERDAFFSSQSLASDEDFAEEHETEPHHRSPASKGSRKRTSNAVDEEQEQEQVQVQVPLSHKRRPRSSNRLSEDSSMRISGTRLGLFSGLKFCKHDFS